LVEKSLFESAVNVRAKAQAPYSHYTVGASVLAHHGGGGKIFSGCNVERCTWTQTTHAEQNAIDSMIASLGPWNILKIFIVGAPEHESIGFDDGVVETVPQIENTPVPCGHCLQIIWENCGGNPNVEILSAVGDGWVSKTTIGDAFPMRFGPKDLGVKYNFEH
ncbi:MAG: hypothetical protein AAB556_01335, partial [Patescibacteria group bacterium]